MKYLAVFYREPVGNPDCPMMHRTGFALGGKTPLGRTGLFSVRLHRFCPDFIDEHPHDHPWPFVTFVIKGEYDDLVPRVEMHCDPSNGARTSSFPHMTGDLVVGDKMRPGKLRYRRAQHIHSTRVGPKGCTTIVVTGPVIRQWGFWSRGSFYSAAVQAYRKRFGTAACE